MFLCFWFRRHRFEEELAEEMRFHRQLRAGRLVSGGMELGLAEREATRQFGNELRHREASGDVWIARWLWDSLQDFRFTARTMSRRPAFAMVAMVTLGLGSLREPRPERWATVAAKTPAAETRTTPAGWAAISIAPLGLAPE